MMVSGEGKNLIVVLGPTASGKTRLGARIAWHVQGEIISADSRQIYRGLDIGAGKDLEEYRLSGKTIPCHLINHVGLETEFSVFHFQQAFHSVFSDCRQRGVMPVLTGGTGLYLESVLRGYALAEVGENPELREMLGKLSIHELTARLKKINKHLHNTTDFTTRARLIRAIEISESNREMTSQAGPAIRALVIGVQWERTLLRERIYKRLQVRMEAGMLEEVAELQQNGISWERLRGLGLEYRYCSDYLRGTISSREMLQEQLGRAICKFAKRQETWFRRMEKKGSAIHWIRQGNWNEVCQLLKDNQLMVA